MSKKLIFAAVGITILTVFLLALAWESGLEKMAAMSIGLPYKIDEKWRLIATSTTFAAIALISPTIFLMWLQRRLTESYLALDITRHRAEFLAKVDPLTGLANRRVFSETVDLLAGGRQGDAAALAVLVIDLDRFKPINDIYGHATGDAVLCAIAERLKALEDRGIVICRLGGDEFGAAMDLRHTKITPQALGEEIIRSLSEPLIVEDREFGVGATIGVSVCPQDGIDTSSLLHAADLAMYIGKRDARGQVRAFHQTMDADVRDRAALEADLREGISHGDVRPHYQPLISLQDGLICGFEVLARWYRKDGTVTPPDHFIPVAEETGLIIPMTFSILRQACLDAVGWPDHLSMAVNISPCQFTTKELPEQISSILKETGFAASRLEIEITESALIADMEGARTTVTGLKALGIQVALDDFGTGYSSLGHLREFQFDKVKIDRSFATSMLSSPKNTMIVEGIVDLCRGLGLATTVEGVETADLMHKLTEIGCEFGQGYLFSKPMAAADIEVFMRTYALKQIGNRMKSVA